MGCGPEPSRYSIRHGHGAFLLGRAEGHVMRRRGGRCAAERSRTARFFAGRMFGLELLVGGYAVARYRLTTPIVIRRSASAIRRCQRLGCLHLPNAGRAWQSALAWRLVRIGPASREAPRGRPHRAARADFSQSSRQPFLRRLEKAKPRSVGQWERALGMT